MVVLRTCRPCGLKPDCAQRRTLAAAVRGMNVGTLTHRCADRQLPYAVGAAVWAYVYEAQPDDDSGGRFWYPGYFLGVGHSEANAVVVIQRGALPEGQGSDGYAFQPIPNEAKRSSVRDSTDTRNGGDYSACRVPWGRVRARDARAEVVCQSCGRVPSIMGCYTIPAEWNAEYAPDNCAIRMPTNV